MDAPLATKTWTIFPAPRTQPDAAARDARNPSLKETLSAAHAQKRTVPLRNEVTLPDVLTLKTLLLEHHLVELGEWEAAWGSGSPPRNSYEMLGRLEATPASWRLRDDLHWPALTSFQSQQILSGNLTRLSYGPHVILDKALNTCELGTSESFLARNWERNVPEILRFFPAPDAGHVSGSNDAMAAFQEKSRRLLAIRHPGVAECYDSLVNGDVAMVAQQPSGGWPLSDVLAMAAEDQQTTPVFWCANKMLQVARALVAIHGAGAVHGNINPHNILIDQEENARLIQTGVAWLQVPVTKNVRPSPFAADQHFLAPEFWHNPSAVSFRSDFYSFGATLYFLLTGQAPFAGRASFGELMAAHAFEPAPNARALRRDVPNGLARFAQRLMAKSPSKRLASATELVAALRPYAVDPKQGRAVRRWVPAAVGTAAAVAAGWYFLLGPSLQGLTPPQPLAENNVSNVLNNATVPGFDKTANHESGVNDNQGDAQALMDDGAEISLLPEPTATKVSTTTPASVEVKSASPNIPEPQQQQKQPARAIETEVQPSQPQTDNAPVIESAKPIPAKPVATPAAKDTVGEDTSAAEQARMLLQETRQALKAGEAASALRQVDEALRLQPELAEARGLRGQLHLAAREYSAAIADLSSAMRTDPAHKAEYVQMLRRAHEGRGTEALASRDPDAALAAFNEAARLDPDRAHEFHANLAQAHDLRARQHQQKDHFSEAVADWREAAKLDPKGLDRYFSQAADVELTRAQNAKDNAEALSHYRAAIELRPTAQAHEFRANLLARLDQHEQASADYARAAALVTDADRKPALEAKHFGSSGHAALARGDLAAAQKAFTDASERDKTQVSAFQALAGRSAAFRATAMFRAGDYASAAAEYLAAAELDAAASAGYQQQAARAWAQAARQALANRQPDAAKEICTRWHKALPHDADARFALAQALRATGDYAPAAEEFLALIEQNPALAERSRYLAAKCWAELGWKALAQSDRTTAANFFDRAAASNPDQRTVYELLARDALLADGT